MPDLPLANKRAVITGGGKGIGAAIAQSLAGNGAHVILLGRTEKNLALQAGSIVHAGGYAEYHLLDVTQPEEVSRRFHQISASGKIHILINNAGAAPSAPFHRLDASSWRETMALNLDAVFFCTRAAIDDMREMKYGRIVNIASTSALKGYAYVSAYSAAKHGVLGLTRSLALETAGMDITVNAVCPGFTETDLVLSAIDNIQKTTGRSAEQARQELCQHNPQGRLITPQEVANSVSWLCCPGSESITGQAIAVCGGEIM